MLYSQHNEISLFRFGQPVYYELLGKIDIKRLHEHGIGVHRLIRYYVFLTEVGCVIYHSIAAVILLVVDKVDRQFCYYVAYYELLVVWNTSFPFPTSPFFTIGM